MKIAILDHPDQLNSRWASWQSRIDRRKKMRISDLQLTGGSYHITPDYWGDCSIIIDEELAIKAVLDCFEDADEKEVRDDLKNSDKVDIAIGGGKYYAILQPYISHGKLYNDNLYRECRDINTPDSGFVDFIDAKWIKFDDVCDNG